MTNILKVLFVSGILMLSMNTLFARHTEQHEMTDIDDIEEIVIQVTGIAKISLGLDFVSMKTEICSHGGDMLMVDLIKDVSFSRPSIFPDVKLEKSGKRLKLYFEKNGNVKLDFFRSGKILFDVRIPESFKGKVRVVSSIHNVIIRDLSVAELVVNNQVGKTEIQDIEADNLEVDNATGNLSIDNIKCKVGQFKCATGNMKCGDLFVDYGEFHNAAGNIVIQSLVAENSFVKNRSGSVKIENISGKMLLKCSLGNLTARVSRFDQDIQVENKTGSIKLMLPQDSAFNYNYTNGCGSVRFDFNRTQEINDSKENVGSVNGGGPMLTASVSTGNLKILSY